MSGYGCFAEVYDELTGNISYSELAEYYDRLAIKFGGMRGILLDLACGTGSTSVEFSRLGYDVIGVDASVDMLSAAMSKPHENITYLCQDMTELDMFGTLDITVCVLDSINHLGSAEEIRKTFEMVSLFTNPGGLFIFDVNTIFKHREILADNVFVYDTDNVYCVWQNDYDESSADNRVNISLDIFRLDENGNYSRLYEEFSEIAVSREQIEKMLTESGFEVCACYEYLTENGPSEQSEKLVFAAKKK